MWWLRRRGGCLGVPDSVFASLLVDYVVICGPFLSGYWGSFEEEGTWFAWEFLQGYVILPFSLALEAECTVVAVSRVGAIAACEAWTRVKSLW